MRQSSWRPPSCWMLCDQQVLLSNEIIRPDGKHVMGCDEASAQYVKLAPGSCDPNAFSARITDDEQRCRSTTGVNICIAGWRSSYRGSIRSRCRRIGAHQQVHSTSITTALFAAVHVAYCKWLQSPPPEVLWSCKPAQVCMSQAAKAAADVPGLAGAAGRRGAYQGSASLCGSMPAGVAPVHPRYC